MSWKLLIAMKSGKMLCHLCTPSPLASCRGGGTLFNFVHFSFFPLCAPVLVFVMGKEAVHGGILNMKAHSMAEYLRKSGY